MRFGLVAVCSALLVTGCTPTATPLPAPSRIPVASPVATVTPVAIPARRARDVSRDVYTGSAHDGVIHDVPRGGIELDLHIARAGPTGSEMWWQIQDGNGSQYSAGTGACNGKEQIDTDQSGPFPEAPVIHLDAPATVLDGSAILTSR